MSFCFRYYTESPDFPEMTGDPVFIGPVEDTLQSDFCPSGTYTDFHFDCQVQYPQQATDNGARFRVSLTFDGKTVSNPDTHVVTTGTATTVSFQSLALTGNVGKTVNISLVLQTHRLSYSNRTYKGKQASECDVFVFFQSHMYMYMYSDRTTPQI